MKEIIWLICGFINIGIGLLHVYISFKGPEALRYYGAGEWMATKAEQGSSFPAIVTNAIALAFFVFALYSFAGAEMGWVKIPLLSYALIAIAALYLLRGSVILAFPFAYKTFSNFDRISTYIALAIGILHAAGAYLFLTENTY